MCNGPRPCRWPRRPRPIFAEQGREQGGREFLLDVLALRFQPEDVQRLASRIEAIEDVQRLKQLHRAAIQVPSLEAFRHLLDADE